MSLDDEEMERYLAEFRPSAIRPLVIEATASSVWPLRVAAVVAMVVLAAGLLWFGHRKAQHLREATFTPANKADVASVGRAETTLTLTKLALTDSENLDLVLAEESRKELPLCKGAQSTLKVLARD